MGKNNAVMFCEKHQTHKHFLPASNKYQCRLCNNEKTAEYRKKFPEKHKESIRKSAEKRRNLIKEDKKLNPDKYKSLSPAAEICDKHEIKRVLGSDGVLICRQCKIEKAREYRDSGKNYELNKLKARIKKFGLSVDQYNEMLKNHDNKCAICRQEETKIHYNKVIGLSVDHCHEAEKEGTMKVRGLLCHSCNTSLGGFKENIQILQSAIDYLKKHKD